jgi:transglutaminase-like putative cysteine protease
MILTASHTTTYLYSNPVSISHNQTHLKPRQSSRQKLLAHELTVSPEPSFSFAGVDYFGNETDFFSIHEMHQTLTITSFSEVEMLPEEAPHAGLTPPWEDVRERMRAKPDEEAFAASEFVCRSPFVKTGPDFAEYARKSFEPGRPLLDGGLDLCHRIYAEFRYDPRATTISTPVDEVLRKKVGVCQDFAHLMITCARSIGLPSRYVSGYLRSGSDSTGSEASHAWCALFCPEFGWLDFDPTNNVMPAGNHVTVAYGRDYSDVTPVRGVALGGGEQIVNVSVKVLRP